MNRRLLIIVVLSLPVVCGVAGYFAGPFLAGASDTAKLAERIHEEDSTGLTERTLESEAFRATGRPAEDLYAEARLVEQRFTIGGMFLGLWCGLVVSVRLLWVARVPPQEIYDLDLGACLACGRCFMSCPRERLRLKEMGRL